MRETALHKAAFYYVYNTKVLVSMSPTTGTWPLGGSQNLSKKRKKPAKLWKLPSSQLVCLLARAQLVIDFFGWITGLETSENVGMWKHVQKDADLKKKKTTLVLH